MIELKEITYDNLKAVIKLSNTVNEQDKKHIAPNVVSLAVAYINYDIAWQRVIVVDDEVVSFVMLGLDNTIAEEKYWPVYFLWRFMMGTKYQVKGYGKQTLDLLVQKCKKKQESIFMSPAHVLMQWPIKCIINMDLKIQDLWMLVKLY